MSRSATMMCVLVAPALLPGQAIVFDSTPGPTGDAVIMGTEGRGRLLMSADDGVHGLEMFAVDAFGTPLLIEFLPGPASSFPALIGRGKDIVFFVADGQLQSRLWRMNPATSVVTIVSPTVDSPGELVPVSNGFVFRGHDTVHGDELWRTDGTTPGTYMLFDLLLGGLSAYPSRFVGNGSIALFNSGQFSNEPWRTDGVTAQLLLDINPTGGSNPSGFLPVGSRWFFTAFTPATGRELWTSDGTTTGTQLLEIGPGSATGAGNPVRCGTRAMLIGDDGVHGAEPWISDGTTAGATMIADIAPGSGSSTAPFVPSMFTVGDGAFFLANDGIHGFEPWFTDGTAAGTHLIADINPGSANSCLYPFLSPQPVFALAIGEDRTVAFVADDGVHGNEIWITDGTPTGTFMLPETLSGPASAEPRDFTRVGPNVFFTADDGVLGRELWSFPTSLTRAAVIETMSPPCTGSQPYPRIKTQSVPRVGNPVFAIGVEQAPPNALAVLLLAFDRFDQQSGGCTVFPHSPGVAFGTITSAAGGANVTVPIPALPFLAGAQLYAQWGAVQFGGPIAGVVTVSDALFVQVGK